MAALEAIPVLTGTNGTGFSWTIYTGDLVSHDAENQLSRCVPTFLIHCKLDRDLSSRTQGICRIYGGKFRINNQHLPFSSLILLL
jgi:hypothetical protein